MNKSIFAEFSINNGAFVLTNGKRTNDVLKSFGDHLCIVTPENEGLLQLGRNDILNTEQLKFHMCKDTLYFMKNGNGYREVSIDDDLSH